MSIQCIVNGTVQIDGGPAFRFAGEWLKVDIIADRIEDGNGALVDPIVRGHEIKLGRTRLVPMAESPPESPPEGDDGKVMDAARLDFVRAIVAASASDTPANGLLLRAAHDLLATLDDAQARLQRVGAHDAELASLKAGYQAAVLSKCEVAALSAALRPAAWPKFVSSEEFSEMVRLTAPIVPMPPMTPTGGVTICTGPAARFVGSNGYREVAPGFAYRPLDGAAIRRNDITGYWERISRDELVRLGVIQGRADVPASGAPLPGTSIDDDDSDPDDTPIVPTLCTCALSQIMVSGCNCGAMARDRAP